MHFLIFIIKGNNNDLHFKINLVTFLFLGEREKVYYHIDIIVIFSIMNFNLAHGYKSIKLKLNLNL